ncbi:MAG: L-lactate dehydrogenase [Promethearchaeota archaeon CR_4]|nr:MAG: L-lactate dehydrogenase [Candidatus Lokiarchaeota archaeon CR_4]
MRYTPKISIIGAGSVGTRFAYATIIRGLARHVVLVDLNKKRAEGEAMDLSHGAPFYNPVKIEAGDYPAIEDSDLIVITAGRNQNPGETRLDLIRDNTKIFQAIIPQCMQYAPATRFLVVTNPVDVLSYLTYKLSRKPASEVIGAGTVLDSARFRYLLGVHCGVDARNVHGYIIGENGDSEFPAWSSVMIGGVPIQAYCYKCDKRSEC